MKKYQLIGFPERDMADFDAQFKHRLSFEPALALSQMTYAHASYVLCHHLELMDVPDWRSHARQCCVLLISQLPSMGNKSPGLSRSH